MGGFVAEAESYLGETLEGYTGELVKMIAPDGATYTAQGKVLRETFTQDTDGQRVIDHKPVVELRRSTLERIPADGEKWVFEIQPHPAAGSETALYLLKGTSKEGATIGVMRFYLEAMVQS